MFETVQVQVLIIEAEEALLRNLSARLHLEGAMAIFLLVSLVIAKYLGVAHDVILYASLVTAGMPFVLAIGAAPWPLRMNRSSSRQASSSSTAG